MPPSLLKVPTGAFTIEKLLDTMPNGGHIIYYKLFGPSLGTVKGSLTALIATCLVSPCSAGACPRCRASPARWTVQYSTVQYSTVQYSTVQYSTVQYSTVQYSTVEPAQGGPAQDHPPQPAGRGLLRGGRGADQAHAVQQDELPEENHEHQM